MKTNSSKFNFITSFKYFMIIPVVMALAAMIIGLIIGFNFDYDYRNVSTFTVKFNTTVSEEEYKVFEDEITKIVVRYDLEDHRIERIGQDAQNGVIVRIVNTDNALDSKIDELKTEIEDNLYTNVQSKVDRSVYISTTDILTNIAKDSSKMIWYTVLAVGCIMVLAFLYNIIRYNIMAGVSVILNILLASAMLTSANVIFRIPLNTGFVLAYAIASMVCVVLSTFVNNGLKPTINDDKYAKSSNAERVYSVVNSKFVAKTLIYMAFIILPLILIAVFSTISTLYTIISIILGLIIAVFTTLFFSTSIWSFWYKREKDIMLKRRQEREKKKLENKDNKTDEKILV